MIGGHKIVAFTPAGRKRYMDILAGYMRREHDRGHIDKWLLFNNAYLAEDSTYADQLADHFSWIEVLRESGIVHGVPDGSRFNWSRPENISQFYKHMSEGDDSIYLRFDDDIVYIDHDCIPRWVTYRLDHPDPFLVFPTIINNVRTSYHFQQHGIVPECGIKDDMYDHVAWRNLRYVHDLHKTALEAIDYGQLVRQFALPNEQFTDWEAGHISINAFAIFGRDMHACTVAHDEEGYLSLHRPKALGRQNARAGDAILIHFAYHTQTAYMDKTGFLNDYARLAPPLGFRTYPLSPAAETSDAYEGRRFILGEIIPPRPRFTIRAQDGSIKERH
jgi:hypothetical protein